MSMRRCAQMLLIWFVAVAADAAVGEYRTFHDSQGRDMKARLLQFNPETNEVKIQLVNRKIRTTKIAVFSDTDQEFIRNWYISKVVFSDKNLIVTINKKALNSERQREGLDGWTPKTSGMKVEEISYELKLESRNKTALEDLKAEYCIYHERTEKGTQEVYEYERVPTREYDEEYEELERGGNNENKRHSVGGKKLPGKEITDTTNGEILIPKLPGKGSYEGLTKGVFLRKGSESKPSEAEEEENSRRRTHEERKVEGKVVGVVFRISIPLASGGYARKEYSYPKDLLEKKKVDWDALKPEPTEEGEKEKESAPL